MIVIEMNPRVSRSLGAGLQGDRLPDRQDRGQAGRRLHARRDPERHHPGDAGLLRADDRLLRGQDPALRLREVPERRPDADDADEVGRRDDGDRPHLQGGAAEGAARPGDRALRASATCPASRTCRLDGLDREEIRAHLRDAARRTASTGSAPRCLRGMERRGDPRATRSIDPWFLEQHRASWSTSSAIVELRRRGLGARRRAAARRPRRSASPTARSRRVPRGTVTEWRRARARASSSACSRSTSWSTPARPSSRPTRRTTTRPTDGRGRGRERRPARQAAS